MSNKYSHFDDTVLDRLKKALNLEKDTQLADFLGVMPTVIANWRSRGRINTTKVITKCESLDINWILFGTNPKNEIKEPFGIYDSNDEIMEKAADHSEIARKDYKKLDERMKKIELENIQLKSKLDTLENLIIRLKKEK